ncbi:tetratricopeptide repeat protein [Polaromonas sp. YR568]|uniref:tetratricopeptide repeat-containing glycosyltransferase family protein n=1 Tax=Polaromonas sp. YR568 TaxID=1855301 RepID=UPI003137B97E
MEPATGTLPETHPAAKDLSSTEVKVHFNHGFAFYGKGQFAQAQDALLQVLQLQPGHAHALHLLGVIAAHTENYSEAVELIGKAVAINPSNALAHNNLGAALEKLQQARAAIDSYDRAITLKPDYAEAYYNRGNALGALKLAPAAVESYKQAIRLQPGFVVAHINCGVALASLRQLTSAMACYDQAIALSPDSAEAHNNRGNALSELNQPDAALKSLHRAIALKPDFSDAHNNLGRALGALQQAQAALESFDQAIALKPDFADAFNNRGLALWGLDRMEAAIESYEQAIVLQPNFSEAYNNRGNALRALGKLEAAINSFDQAIALRPDYFEAYSNRGNALIELGQFRAALESYEKAIEFSADYFEAYSNRGNALTKLGQLRAAVESYDKAIEIKPGYAEAHYNRGIALGELKQALPAIASYEKAIALKDDYVAAHWNQALCLLQAGDLERGWQKYEWRWQVEGMRKAVRSFAEPAWFGKETLQGKTILLHAEQGLGDTLQFCRYAKLVSDSGARVILEVQEPLVKLMSGLDGVAELVAGGKPRSAFDYHCPLLSLPLALGTRLNNIPASQAYLTSPAGKTAQWSIRLGAKTRPRVGLVWSGRATHKNDHNRSFLLSALLPFLPVEFQYISLQKELHDEDRETLRRHPHILHFEEDIDEFTDTAALCALVDVIVTVDTSVAHLAGALGRPVWIALPFNPDWRWLLERDDSPWYPSAKLYRQEVAEVWDPVFKKIGAHLRRFFAL